MRSNAGRFIPGEHPSPRTEIKPRQRFSPATEIRPGQRLSKETEFQKGQPARNRLPLGSERTRVEANTGLPRVWVKVAEPNVWQKRAALVWVAAHGPLPRGWVVHHHDRNSTNDELSNLVALTRAQHVEEHRLELALAQVASLTAKARI